jgi:hypothetical protein
MQVGANGTNWCINAQVREIKLRQNISQRTHLIEPKTHVLGCFGPFRYSIKVDAKWTEQVQLMHKFVKQCCIRIFAMNAPNPLHWTQNSSSVSDLVSAWKSVQNWPNFCHKRTSLVNEDVLEFFATNAPDPLHGIKTQVLGCFKPFRYCMVQNRMNWYH